MPKKLSDVSDGKTKERDRVSVFLLGTFEKAGGVCIFRVTFIHGLFIETTNSTN